jgi:hypothetical protein
MTGLLRYPYNSLQEAVIIAKKNNKKGKKMINEKENNTNIDWSTVPYQEIGFDKINAGILLTLCSDIIMFDGRLFGAANFYEGTGKNYRLKIYTTNKISTIPNDNFPEDRIHDMLDLSAGWQANFVFELAAGGSANNKPDDINFSIDENSSPRLITMNNRLWLIWCTRDYKINGMYIDQGSQYWSGVIRFNFDTVSINSTNAPIFQAYAFGNSLNIVVPKTTESSKVLEFCSFNLASLTPTSRDSVNVDLSKDFDYKGTDTQSSYSAWKISEHISLDFTKLDQNLTNNGRCNLSPFVAAGQVFCVVMSFFDGYKQIWRTFIKTCNHVGDNGEVNGLPDGNYESTMGKMEAITPFWNPDGYGTFSIKPCPDGRLRTMFCVLDSLEYEAYYLNYDANLNDGNNPIEFTSAAWVKENFDPGIPKFSSSQYISYSPPAHCFLFGPLYSESESLNPENSKIAYSNVYSIVWYNSGEYRPGNYGQYALLSFGMGKLMQKNLVAESGDTISSFAELDKGILAKSSAEEISFNVTGFSDGPLPVPNENIDNLIGGFLGASVASTTVGLSQVNEQNVLLNHEIGLGVDFKSKVKGTLKAGIGQYIEGNISATINAFFSTSINWGTESSINYSRQTDYISKSALGPVSKNDPSHSKLLNSGIVFGMKKTAGRLRSYQWITPNNVIGNPNLVPVTVIGVGGIPTAVNYQLSVVEAGNLASYDPAKINLKMRDLYNNLETYQKDDLNRSFKNYDKYIKNLKYIEEIVMPNAFQFSNSSDFAMPFMECIWANGGEIKNLFHSTTSLMTSEKYTWSTKLEAGAGYSVELGTDIWAVKASLFSEVELLGRVTYNGAKEKKGKNASSFGLTVDLTNVRAGVNENEVTAYGIKIYYLKPNTLWAKELSYMFGVKNINLETPCWKLMYSVDPNSITRVSPQGN